MTRKLEFFLTGNFKPDLLKKFKKEVSLIKFEAEKLDTCYESYYPYYLLVYSYLKVLIEEGIITNDKFARGNFHKVWVLAEETDDLRTTLQNQHLPLTEYGKAVKEGRNNSDVYTVEKFQYERNLKRLDLIVESIRFQAKEAKMKDVGIAGRVAFFYHTLCCQDPCFTVAMNKLLIKLNHDLYDENFEWINDTRRLLPDVVKKTFMTDMKCFMCMFGTGKYATEPDFYYHSVLSHTSFRMICNVPKCEAKAVNRIRMESHVNEQHSKSIGSRKGFTCRGCSKWHLTLSEVSKCEESCVKTRTSKKLSIYYWEKYYLIWSGQVDDDFTLDQYFFSRQSSGNDEGKVTEPQVDESLFNVSFGSDFDSSWDGQTTEEGCEKKEEGGEKKEDGGKKKEEGRMENGKGVTTKGSVAVREVKDNVAQRSPVKVMTAKEALEKEWGNLYSTIFMKRKAPTESEQHETSEIGDLKKALADQKDYFKAKIAKLDEKMDQVFSMVKMIKECIDKK